MITVFFGADRGSLRLFPRRASAGVSEYCSGPICRPFVHAGVFSPRFGPQFAPAHRGTNILADPSDLSLHQVIEADSDAGVLCWDFWFRDRFPS